jgi:hypothetical protein
LEVHEKTDGGLYEDDDFADHRGSVPGCVQRVGANSEYKCPDAEEENENGRGVSQPSVQFQQNHCLHPRFSIELSFVVCELNECGYAGA